ncbi:hypothetical protein C8N43_2839 [Litoreibacter ponti]|uniref:Uncharacterized protein n=1 Tax=Litoreibacter ponti TaxID=1510457 RepID=A0A2T6BDB2_9RHOB|nr:hypothetical protein [Litoreibacter ponti]PTX54034.1 hypothetical protein C8N43_2839 [Litoreibacter ponti]
MREGAQPDPATNLGDFVPAHPIDAAWVERALALVRKEVGEAELRLEVVQDNGTRMTVGQIDAAALRGEGLSSFSISGRRDAAALYLNFHPDDGLGRVYITSEAPTAEAAAARLDTLAAALQLEVDRKHSKSFTAKELTRVSTTALSAAVVLDAIEALSAAKTALKPAKFHLSKRRQKDYNSAEMDLAALKQALGDLDEFHQIRRVRASFYTRDGDLDCTFTLPTGLIDLYTWATASSTLIADACETLDAQIGLQRLSQARDTYRSGTLTYEIGRWSPHMFEDGLKRMVGRLRRRGRPKGAQGSDSGRNHPAPEVTHLFLTRDGQAQERFDGPVEVLEPYETLPDFFEGLGDGYKTLRAINVSLEAHGMTRINLAVNVRDKRLEFWGNDPLIMVQDHARPLIDGLRMKLVEGEPGTSLPERPSVLEVVTTQVSRFSGLIKAGTGGLAALGVGGAGLVLLGWSAVEVSHPVANGERFEAAPVEALYLDWRLEKPILRRALEAVTQMRLPDALDLTVFENGMLRSDLSQQGVSGGVTLPLTAGTYRIDFDHPTWSVRDATVFVTVKAPE